VCSELTYYPVVGTGYLFYGGADEQRSFQLMTGCAKRHIVDTLMCERHKWSK